MVLVGQDGRLGSRAGQHRWPELGAISRAPADSPTHAFRQSKISYGGLTPPAAWVLQKGEYITTPRVSFWENPNFIPANVYIRVVLTKAKDAFCIADQVGTVTTPDTSTANISWDRAGLNTVRLMLRRVYPSSAILERPLRYNLTRSRIERANIQQSTSVDLTNMLSGVRPDLVIVQLVATAAVEGNYSYNPFCSTSVIQTSAATILRRLAHLSCHIGSAWQAM